MQKIFSKAAEKAKRELSKAMDRQLKKNALKDGWDPEVAMGLTVSYDNGVFSTSHEPAHSDQVFTMEYGMPTSSPKATIRKLQSDSESALDAYAKLFEKNLLGGR